MYLYISNLLLVIILINSILIDKENKLACNSDIISAIESSQLNLT